MDRTAVLSKLTLLAFLAGGPVACNSDDPTPTNPGNRAPAITIGGSAAFGIAQITTFVFSAAATDPDANPVSVTWTFGDGTTGAGTTVWKTFASGGSREIVATVKDHLGATTTSNILAVTVGSADGAWSGTIDLAACGAGTKPVEATLSQSGSAITGTVSLPEGLCSSSPGTMSIGSADPGRMFGNGAVRLHVVIPPSIDVSFEGQMATTGQQITGTLQGSDPSGMAFTLTRQ